MKVAITMLKAIISKFLSSSEQEPSVEEIYSVLNNVSKESADFSSQPNEELRTEYDCHRKIGVITSIENDKYIIDDIYDCERNDLSLTIGTKISFTIYSTNGTIQVTNVKVIDDWDNESEQKSIWCNRSLITKVIRRDKRDIFISPGDITIDLNAVCSEFVPIVGDWLDLDVKCEVDENVTNLAGRILEINKISPLRPKIIEGIVKIWNSVEQNGVINQNVFFNRESLDAGYVPIQGDKVVTEIIESEQGRCSWRSLKVLLDGTQFEKSRISKPVCDYILKHDDVNISNNVFLDFEKLSESKEFEFKITNLTNLEISLLNVKLDCSNSQCKLIHPVNYPMVIKCKETLLLRGSCVVKNVGESRELLLLMFENFIVGRFIHIQMQYHNKIVGEKYNRTYSTDDYKSVFKSKDVIRGPRPIAVPHFIAIRLPDYPVPQKLFDLVVKYNNNNVLLEDLKTMKPVLTKDICFQYYEDRFHTLLFLEEIESLLSIRKYDQEKACFIKNGEFLMLEIENLSEQRPSIISGDKVIATDPYDSNNLDLEGYVYKVGAKHVYLKFVQIFHDQYNGEDYSIKVIQSRSHMRRLHQAVGLAIKHLGREFLFPSKVIKKEHQVNFSYDKYEDDLNNTLKMSNKLQIKNPKKLSNKELLQLIRLRNQGSTKDDINTLHKSSSKLIVDSDDKENNVNLIAAKEKHFKLEWYNQKLNYYQKEAVRNILLGESRPLPYFIFGPPGTGKTVTVVETILQLLRLIPHSRLLVAAPSNSAADLIAIRLIDSGVLKPGDLVRLVAYKCVSDNTIPTKLVPYSATISIAKEGSTIQNTIKESGLILDCSSSVIGRHRITVGTCSTIGTLYAQGFPKGHFTHIVIDEAAQTSEPECMIPLSFLDLSSGQVVLAGDPMQLGAVVNSKFAAEYGLKESFMERILNRFPYVRDIEGFPITGGYDPRLVTRLIYNYRSLSEILELPNSMFYHSELMTTISTKNSTEATLLNNIKEMLPTRDNDSPPSFVFHGVDGENYQTFDSPSWYNPYEASQIFYYINELYRLGISSKDIGIISPYVKQVKQIRSILLEAEFDIPKIGTVEEFQGQEFNIILLSTVRSNKNMIEDDRKHNLGFIFNPRRFNVAITRARVLVLIVGNPFLLATDVVWRNALAYAVKNGSYCGCDISSVL